jgi:hypothetical protein
MPVMRLCPCCKEYGDVWEVEFTNLDGRRAVMCFECDTVWDIVSDVEDQSVYDFETLMEKHGLSPDWKQIRKLQRELPEPPSP